MPDSDVLPVTVEVHLDPADWSTDLAEQTRRGLVDDPPWVPPVWFYDDDGSVLFDEITRLPEYYPTRAERSILAERADEIARRTDAEVLIELGSGTSEKTRLLLDAFVAHGTLTRFVPFDCSEGVLREAAVAIAEERPGLEVAAVVGDFHEHLGQLPADGRRLVAFLGSTIGNFDPSQRAGFLRQVSDLLGDEGALLLGTDLVKDADRLVAAYDDAAGVTAAFDLNALRVLNRELGADFDVAAWSHEAHWDPDARRIEMRVVASDDQVVRFAGLDGLEVCIPAGGWLRTEISTKFTRDQVAAELAAVGLAVDAQWTDEAGDFLLTLARPARSSRPAG